ncbi:putative cytoplasmic protein [Salmonella enterica subsp. enterica serovar Typhimurium]|nr:putative cytoplasmic protein [Salmonella enterica subsp. enterica serovar Typhimurium]
MRALLTPEIAPRMGVVLFRPGSELMPLFMQGRVLLEPEPEQYSSFACGASRRYHSRWRMILLFVMCSVMSRLSIVLVVWLVWKAGYSGGMAVSGRIQTGTANR